MTDCTTCAHAAFEYTPTGRIKKHPGRCKAPLPDLKTVLPWAYWSDTYFHRMAVWPGDGKDCPTWRAKEQENKS